jgi:hypothetical protein
MKLNQVFSFLVARSQHSNLLIKFNLRYCYAKQIKEGSFARGTCNHGGGRSGNLLQKCCSTLNNETFVLET